MLKDHKGWLVLLLLVVSAWGGTRSRAVGPLYALPAMSDTFPIPPDNEQLLFYIQRSLNTNTIVYELNPLADGSLNKKEPVSVYWLRYQHEGGRKKDLDFIQRHYAYGIKCKVLDERKGSYKLNLVSYDKRDIYLIRSEKTGKYRAYITINGHMNELRKIFFEMEGDGGFSVPDVKYIEISGKEMATGKPVAERFNP